MAVLRYVVLTIHCAFAGMRADHALGRPAFYGFLAGLIVASGISSTVFFTWMQRFLNRLEADARAAGSPGQAGPALEPGPERFTAPVTMSGEGPAPISARPGIKL